MLSIYKPFNCYKLSCFKLAKIIEKQKWSNNLLKCERVSSVQVKHTKPLRQKMVISIKCCIKMVSNNLSDPVFCPCTVKRNLTASKNGNVCFYDNNRQFTFPQNFVGNFSHLLAKRIAFSMC